MEFLEPLFQANSFNYKLDVMPRKDSCGFGKYPDSILSLRRRRLRFRKPQKYFLQQTEWLKSSEFLIPLKLIFLAWAFAVFLLFEMSASKPKITGIYYP